MSQSGYTIPQIAVDTFLNGVIFQLYAQAKGEPTSGLALPVVSDAASIHEVLSQPALFAKSLGLVATLGDSRFNANGAEWEVRRDLTQKFYLSAGSSRNAPAVSAIYDARFAACEASPEAIQRALMLAATEAFFGALNCKVNVERLLGLFGRARLYVKRLQYFSWNTVAASDAAVLNGEARDLACEFEAEVRQSPQLCELMVAFRNRAERLQDFNPFDELLMNFFAGIETTAATLCFAIDRLGIDPRVERRLYDEVVAGQGEAYLDCFVQETLRYFPTIPFVVRQTTAETVLNGTMIPKGQSIIVSIVGLHHNALYWNEPDIFDCSRREFLDSSYNRQAFLPFLSGPRMCGGARLARLELLEGLRAFVRRFSVKREGDEIGLDYGIALRPGPSAKVTIRRRVP